MRLRPTTAVPECSVHCLRSTGIQLKARSQRRSYVINRRVTVQDENDAPIAAALVVARWTQPDGSTHDENAWTGLNGAAAFATTGPRGTYTLRVVNILRSQYTFNPSRSVLEKSITVPR